MNDLCDERYVIVKPWFVFWNVRIKYLILEINIWCGSIYQWLSSIVSLRAGWTIMTYQTCVASERSAHCVWTKISSNKIILVWKISFSIISFSVKKCIIMWDVQALQFVVVALSLMAKMTDGSSLAVICIPSFVWKSL